MTDPGLLRRAQAAWFRTGGTDPVSQQFSGVAVVEGREYVVLRREDQKRGLLAVYRVRNDGMLKRLRRWPPDIA